MTECTCEACKALAARYTNDPGLLALYRKKLLIRGWAGETDKVEKAYILAHAEWAQAAVRAGAGTRLQARKRGDQTPLTEAEQEFPDSAPVAALITDSAPVLEAR